MLDIATLILVVGTVGSQSLMAAPLLPDMAGDLAAPTARVGLALGAYGAATAVSALLLGPSSDRFRRGAVLAGGMVLLGAGLAVSATASSWLSLALGQAIGGSAAGALLPTAYAAAGDLAPPERRATLMGRVLLGWSLALVAGVPAGGLLGDLLGWRGVFLLVAGLALAVAGLAVRLPERRPAGAPRPGPSLRAALAVPGVPPLLVLCALMMAGFYGSYGYLGAYVRGLHGSGAASAGTVVLAYGLGFTAGTWSGPRIDRLGPARVLAAATATLVAIYALLPLSAQIVPVLLAHMALLGVVNHVALNTLVTLLTSASAERRGSVMAVNSAVTYVGFTAGSAGMGYVFDAWGFPWVAAGSALLLGGATLAIRLGGSVREARLHAA